MRNKIDYGIDLGTTNSAIARMENGFPTIKKTDTLKDTLPSCVHFNRRQNILVGDTSYNTLNKDSARALKNFEPIRDTFIEFKRTMGTTHKYESSNMKRNFSPEELSAEVLKKLKSFIQDEDISSIVITVPAKFLNPQKEATIQAAKLAGFKHVELLQEPVAAATAFGLTAKDKDNFWLVFDFGGGTFDAAILKAEEGILTVKDTDGDNWLGGKNLDEAIVDQIIIPFLQENYAIDFVINDVEKRELLRNALKFRAEEAKIQLSFNDKHHILSELDEFPFEDENGETPEIDINISIDDLENVIAPIFQKAIDITKDLLKRNNLKGQDLGALILVGGPTHSPILRRMLKEQVTENIPTDIDPMTVVAQGAALFASTISVSEEVKDEVRDKTKLQLDIKYEATSVETDVMINIKILADKTEGQIPEKVYADIVRGDKGWSSGKKLISERATLIDVHLTENQSNLFTVNLFDEQGNRLDCQPNQFSILQGIEVSGMSTLPYHIGIGKWFDEYEKVLLTPVKGLEKNKKLPATGVKNDLKTRSEVRPGIASDIIKIPIYQGEYYSEGTNPIFNNLVQTIIITGENVPGLLPENSPVEITIKVDRSEQMLFSAYFPTLEHTEEFKVQIEKTKPPTVEDLKKDISDAKKSAMRIDDTTAIKNLEELEAQLKIDGGSADGKLKILEELRKKLLKLDEAEKATLLPELEQDLKNSFYDFEDLVEKIKKHKSDGEININRVEAILEEIRKKVEAVIKDKNIKDIKDLTSEINSLTFNLRNEATSGAVDAQYLQYLNNEFTTFHWLNPTKARQLINQAMQQLSDGNNKIRPFLVEIVQLLPKEEQGIGGELH